MIKVQGLFILLLLFSSCSQFGKKQDSENIDIHEVSTGFDNVNSYDSGEELIFQELEDAESDPIRKVKPKVNRPIAPEVITDEPNANEEEDLVIAEQRKKDSIQRLRRADSIRKKNEQVSLEVPFVNVEKVPIFPGCENVRNKRKCFEEKIQEHIRKYNIRYPKVAQEKGIQGRVAVMFTVKKDGSIGNIRTRGPDKSLEEAAERIIKLIPRLIPGMQDDRPVDVPYGIPIVFKLE